MPISNGDTFGIARFVPVFSVRTLSVLMLRKCRKKSIARIPDGDVVDRKSRVFRIIAFCFSQYMNLDGVVELMSSFACLLFVHLYHFICFLVHMFCVPLANANINVGLCFHVAFFSLHFGWVIFSLFRFIISVASVFVRFCFIAKSAFFVS